MGLYTSIQSDLESERFKTKTTGPYKGKQSHKCPFIISIIPNVYFL